MFERSHQTAKALSGARRILCVLCAASLFACSDSSHKSAAASAQLEGRWRAVLTSPGGDLPFGIEILRGDDPWSVVVINGEERFPVDRVETDGNRVTLAFDGYDSEIIADLEDEGSVLVGRWRKTQRDEDTVMPFRATRGQEHRFLEDSSLETPNWSIAGSWTTTFTDEDGEFPARGEFTQDGAHVRGTFRTTTGDYRFLAGAIQGDRLFLSTFDGAHAFLFTAEHLNDDSLAGDFYSRDTYHATFVAQRASATDRLPDGWTQVGLTNDQGAFRFRFPDPGGEVLGSDDEQFDGKVLLVDIFGSWCPNCNDSAPLLAAWDREYRERGLRIVGLAFEVTGDFERDAEFVRRFARRHEIEYPLLVAGTSDKSEAGEVLPDLEAVLSFPTKVFIDRQGKVRRIHSGFDGPGTGDIHDALVEELESLIETLLDETG